MTAAAVACQEIVSTRPTMHHRCASNRTIGPPNPSRIPQNVRGCAIRSILSTAVDLRWDPPTQKYTWPRVNWMGRSSGWNNFRQMGREKYFKGTISRQFHSERFPISALDIWRRFCRLVIKLWNGLGFSRIGTLERALKQSFWEIKKEAQNVFQFF